MILSDLRETCEATIARLLREPMQLLLDHEGTRNENLTYQLLAGDSTICVCVQLRNRLRPADIPQIAGQSVTGECEHQMLFTNYVTANLADRLRNDGIWFADAQGNAFLEIPGKLLIHTIGNKPQRLPAPTGQHFSAPGGKILHFLLKHGPNIHTTYREIREVIGVSIDKIGKLIRELEQNGLLQIRGSGNYEILTPARLLALWIDAYEAKLRPALLLGRYTAAADRNFETLIAATDVALGGRAIVGGEVAADALTHHLRPGRLRIYIPEGCATDTRRDLKLAPTEHGTIELCKLYSLELASEKMIHGLAIADPAFVYAELMADGDSRLAETAMRLRQGHLAWTL